MEHVKQVLPIVRWRDNHDEQVQKLVEDLKKAGFRAPQCNAIENRNFCAKCAYCIRFFYPADCASIVSFHPQQHKSFVRGGWTSRFDGYILGFNEKAPPKPNNNHAKRICDSCILKKLETGGLNVVYVPAVGYVTDETGKFDPTPQEIANQLEAIRDALGVAAKNKPAL